MERRNTVDAAGVVALLGFAALFGLNQVVIKVVNEGLQPVFWAGLRSAGATLIILGWIRLRRIPLRLEAWRWGVMVGMIFSIEFILLFLALDLTTVTRTGVIFYSMPVWLTLAAHFLLPAERMTPRRALGLALAFAGVAWAIADRGAGGGAGSIWGDLMSLAAAFCWAGAILFARATPLKTLPAETQILWQVAVSTPVLLAVSPLFGPLVRDLAPVHLWGLAFQILGVASFGFILWFWLLKIYPASAVASFAFLSPVFSVLLGWLLLGEEVGLSILGSLALVSAGIVLVNRPARRSQVPQ